MSDRTLPIHAPAPHPRGLDPRRRWALVVLCLAQFMVILDITVVNVALPTIGTDLQLDRTLLTWVVTAYTLCFGGLLLLGGRLADTFGRRRTFLAGLGVFTAASLASGLAQTGTVLIAARAGQGMGAALLSPAALAIITTTFQGAERNRAQRAGFDMRQQHRQIEERHLHLLAEQIVDGGRSAPIRHVHDVDPGRLLEQFTGKMRHTANAGG